MKSLSDFVYCTGSVVELKGSMYTLWCMFRKEPLSHSLLLCIISHYCNGNITGWYRLLQKFLFMYRCIYSALTTCLQTGIATCKLSNCSSNFSLKSLHSLGILVYTPVENLLSCIYIPASVQCPYYCS